MTMSRWSRRLVAMLGCIPLAVAANHDQQDSEQEQDSSVFHFRSRPDILAPKWDIHTYDEAALQHDGHYWFTSPYAKLEQDEFPPWNGPHIYDTAGDLVWSGVDLVQHINTHDFRAAIVDGQSMLSYIWCKGNSVGNGYILDPSYSVHRVVDMDLDDPNRRTKRYNMHEFNLIDGGKRALMITNPESGLTDINLPEYNGTCNIGWQGFREIDVQTGKILFDWEAEGHIAIEESTFLPDSVKEGAENTWEGRCDKPWDMTHFNAVDKLPDGDYLLSARHTDSVYKISHKTKKIVWRLGGEHSDFRFKSRTSTFSRQHDARYQSHNDTHLILSIFDNATGKGKFEESTADTSWGIILALNTQEMTAELVTRFKKPDSEEKGKYVYTDARGSMSIMPNGNAFLGWARKSQISEHAPDGKLLMSAMLDQEGLKTYRTYKMPWVGTPASSPDVVAQAESRGSKATTEVHVSWNGATEVVKWELHRSNLDGSKSSNVASATRTGFETKITLDSLAQYVYVVARDARDRELGRSSIIAVEVPLDLQFPALADSEKEWLASLAKEEATTTSTKTTTTTTKATPTPTPAAKPPAEPPTPPAKTTPPPKSVNLEPLREVAHGVSWRWPVIACTVAVVLGVLYALGGMRSFRRLTRRNRHDYAPIMQMTGSAS